MMQGKMKRTGNTAGNTKDLLAHLLTGDRQATTDTLLHVLSASNNDKDGDNGDDDGNDREGESHIEDGEDNDEDEDK